ncbi:MAG: hypothetical protein Q7T01_00235 [bacterium]|nr:hypothetical protein [bacterium]
MRIAKDRFRPRPERLKVVLSEEATRAMDEQIHDYATRVGPMKELELAATERALKRRRRHAAT